MSSRLSAALQRLYRVLGDTPVAGDPALRSIGAEGQVRAMVMSLSRPADWSVLASVWRGVQADLELPAPAIAVNGVDAYELWFSLADAIPNADANAFLKGLRQRYLGDVKPHRVALWPSLEGAQWIGAAAPIPAAVQGDSGHWSSFVAPDLAAVFGDEPWLDLPPGEDAQADLLSRLKCISSSAFAAALEQLQTAAIAPAVEISMPPTHPPVQAMNGHCDDPKRFLQDVMNDASVPMASRIEAAKALLRC